MNFVCFWGHEDEATACFSNWYKSPFQVNNVVYNCVEQYMMREKAILFGDFGTAYKIMQTDIPREQKQLGRQVQGYNDKIWQDLNMGIVYQAIYCKFLQKQELYNKILSFDKEAIFIEASPYDDIWGVGMNKEDFLKHYQKHGTIPGQNKLGRLITHVRDILCHKY